jgi:SAM-dependent methyltransferase
MSRIRIIGWLFVSLLCVPAFPSLARAQSAQPNYAPRVGQAGKDVVWVPTPDAMVEKMLDMAKVTANDYVIDLGSGDGRTVITAAQRGARAHGIEYNPDMVELSKRNAAAAGVADKATFVKADLFETDFSKAQVITMFLLPSINLRLRPTILNMKPGTRIVSHAFRMAGWRADRTDTLRVKGPHPGQGDESTLYLWVVPADVRGAWTGDGLDLRIDQNYQDIDVQGADGATLRGDQIAWHSPGGSFRGRVQGERIAGELSAEGRTRAVTLRRSR